MNILFIMLAFPKLSKHSMYTDLVRKFYDEGHNVYPIAPLCKDVTKTGIYNEDNIKVLRVKTLNLFDPNPIKKGLANISLPFLYKKAINKYWSDISFDLIIIPTPTVMFVDVAEKIKEKCKAKIYLILRDIFPQNAVDLGLMNHNGILYNYFRKKEKKLYQISDKIGCTSQGNIDFIQKQEGDNLLQKLHVLNNFSRTSNDSSNYNVDDIKEKYGLKDKYVAVFGGNMGKPQQVENVLNLAKYCSHIYDDVIFLLIGSGTQFDLLKDKVKNMGINNILFLARIPNDEYRSLLSICDVGIISLHKDFTVPNTPYKLNDYLALKLPVLASIDYGTDLGKILEVNKMGLFAYADKPDDLYTQFDVLYKSPSLRKTMGENGIRFFNKNMTLEVAYNIIIENISKSC